MGALVASTFPAAGADCGSVDSPVDRERVRLLLDIKFAADFYDLHFAIAEHSGYVRGLFMSGQISGASLTIFQLEARRVADASAGRLAEVIQ